ncbi:MAG TPA: FAD-dependent oxidoreductase [Solirubrobacteraceae bacterium]
MRIAIIGTGISGLTAAHLLHPAHEITVFEAGDHVGGHTNTIVVDAEDGRWDVDTGFIVCNDRNYPLFEAMLDELGVARQPTNMSFSVSAEDEDFEYSSHGPRGLLAQPANLARRRFLAMVADYLRFNRAARRLLAEPADDRSLGAFLKDERFSPWFVDRLLVPQAAAVWSADPAQMWTFPARFLAQFFAHHGMLSLTGRPRWSTVAGGSARYVEALTAPFAERIRVRTPVLAMTRHPTHVELVLQGGAPEAFDEVVVASHADDALALLTDPSPGESEVLGAFAYQVNEAVLHTDRSLLPRRRAAWSAWNYHLPAEPRGRCAVTYYMNYLQALEAEEPYCVTLNRTAAIDPERIIRVIPYAHPVFTRAAVQAQTRHAEVSGVRRTHYCGAYWGWGFHEDGVASAHRALARMRDLVAA